MQRGWFGVGLVMMATVAGCDLRERYVATSPALWVPSGPATGLEAVGSVGPAPNTAWVRAVNNFGAAVASDPGSVTLGGVATPVAFDGVGYSTLAFDVPGVVSIGGVATPVQVYTHGQDYVPPGMVPAALAPVGVDGLAARVTAGSVGVVGSEVWWSDDAGHRAHRVLDTGAAILGLKVVQADVDDLLDVLVWTSDTVFVLRARNGGGMAWGGALQAPGYTVGGVGIGDLSSDNIPDIAVAWARAGTGLVEVWHGDGVFGFSKTEARELKFEPASLLVADSTGEGQPQVTLLFSDGTWERYIEGAPGRLMPIGPATPQSIAPRPGWVLEKALDLDGDGLDEIPASTSYNPLTAQRSMLIYDLGEGLLSALPIEDEPSPWYGVGDGDGDLIEDVWLHRTDGTVQVLHYEATAFGPSYPRKVVLRGTPGLGPIDLDDIDGDGHNDLWIAAPHVWWATRGRGIVFDPERFWEPQRPEDTFVREDLAGGFRFAEFDGDTASLEIAAVTKEGSQLELSVLRYMRDDVRADRSGRTDLAGSTIVDVEVCGQTVYALTDNALHAVAVAADLRPSVTAQVTLADPRDVVCGAGPGGAAVTVAANGEIISYSASLAELDRTASAAYGVAYGNLDGTGVQVHACVTEGCALTPWTLSGGTAGLLVLDPTSATWVDAAGTATAVPGFADSVRLHDLDGDGVLEAVGHDEATGIVSIFREVGGAVAPAHLWQSASPSPGGIGLDDADLDGDVDVWGIDAEGNLRYGHELRDEPDPTGSEDTGDTGPATGSGDTGSAGSTGDTSGGGTDTGAHTGDTGSTATSTGTGTGS